MVRVGTDLDSVLLSADRAAEYLVFGGTQRRENHRDAAADSAAPTVP
jgi:hypothetical protein